jgi:hypothetical protein
MSESEPAANTIVDVRRDKASPFDRFRISPPVEPVRLANYLTNLSHSVKLIMHATLANKLVHNEEKS